MVKKQIVVLGAGIAGLRVVQDLVKKFSTDELKRVDITLVDASDVHMFRADLYEVATAFNKEISADCLLRLKGTVATPIAELVDGRHVNFIHDVVKKIDGKKRRVLLKRGKAIDYDYLVVALGSETNYFGIDGLWENSFPLKTVQDALTINRHLDQYFQKLWRDGREENVCIVVGGGGATGVEVAAELLGALKRLCKKYAYPYQRVSVILIEGSDHLGAMDAKGTKIVLRRLKKLGVRVMTKSFISKVSKKEILVKPQKGRAKSFEYSVLIWTGGVQVSEVVQKCLGDKKCRGGIKVNKFLQMEKDEKVFAAGDNAYFSLKGGQAVPWMAQAAYEEGKAIAKNLLRIFRKEELEAFVPPKTFPLVLPIGGKFAVMRWGRSIYKGFLVWLLKRAIYFKYALSILPFWKAYRKLHHSTKIFLKND